MKYRPIAPLVFAALCALGHGADKIDARTIEQRVHDRDDGKDSYAKVEMLLTDRLGLTQTRSMIIANKDFGKLSKTCLFSRLK